jgi:hypothetical protein
LHLLLLWRQLPLLRLQALHADTLLSCDRRVNACYCPLLLLLLLL